MSGPGPGEGDAGSKSSFQILFPVELECEILPYLVSREVEERRNHRFWYLALVCIKGFINFKAFP